MSIAAATERLVNRKVGGREWSWDALASVTVVDSMSSSSYSSFCATVDSIGAEGIITVTGGGLVRETIVSFNGGEGGGFTGFVVLIGESKVGRGDEG